MPEEEKNELKNTLYNFNKLPIAYFHHNANVTFYIYYGYNLNSDLSKTYYYYYAFSIFDEYFPTFNLYLKNKTLSISNDNRYGLLTSIDESITDDFTLSFIIETEDRKCEYIIQNCDFK